MGRTIFTAAGVAVLSAGIAPVNAADVTFTGIVTNSCVLNLSTAGVLAPTTDGTTLATETGGGAAAVLVVVAVGTAPTLNFSAPTVTTPNGFSGTAIATVRYTSTGGANQAHTSAPTTVRTGGLLDTFTVNSRVSGPAGFASGTYGVRTVVTCQQ